MLHWLNSRLFYPLIALSGVALGLFYLWAVVIGPWDGPRLPLNLFLAWMPYLAALMGIAAHQRVPQQRWLFRFIFIVWLIFFPNAPYLITDWLYLPGWQSHLWYTIILLTAFTICGLMLAAVSLHLMQTVITLRAGRTAGTIVCVIALVLSGAGVYLGRFLRLNSWDLFTHPRTVLSEAWETIQNQQDHTGLIGFSALFALLLGATYYAIVSLRRTDWSREEYGVWSQSHRRPHDSGSRHHRSDGV